MYCSVKNMDNKKKIYGIFKLIYFLCIHLNYPILYLIYYYDTYIHTYLIIGCAHPNGRTVKHINQVLYLFFCVVYCITVVDELIEQRN